ncbi:MAG: response regulator transcription factor [Candidatus Obscuribacterales bacterium]|nr:response regulator transcription factor [Candidatus Obscuribacterales bacterium]
MAKVLLVEDDSELAETLVSWLRMENFTVERVALGEDGLQLLENYKYDLVVLDWGLPNLSGLELLRKFRAAGGSTPVIFLTGKDDISSKELGLDTGADDYLTKPFDVRELGARIRSLLRRPGGLLPKKIAVGNLALDTETRKVLLNSGAVRLTNREFSVLEFLLRHQNQVFSARALMDAVWPSESEASEDTVRSCVKNLRRKITEGDDCVLKTIPGAGYIIESSE